jgi:hypothetical protein
MTENTAIFVLMRENPVIADTRDWVFGNTTGNNLQISDAATKMARS